MHLIRKITKGVMLLLLVSLLALLYIGLQGSTLLAQAFEEPSAGVGARVAIAPTVEGSSIAGQVTLSLTEGGMLIQATVNHALPGEHGFHIHEGESCADGGNAAKGHFNPDGVQHGDLVVDGFSNAHAGDLGNIAIAADGTGNFDKIINGLTFAEGRYAVANHAIILHEQVDDLGQPTGNAAGRIGCGIIQVEDF